MGNGCIVLGSLLGHRKETKIKSWKLANLGQKKRLVIKKALLYEMLFFIKKEIILELRSSPTTWLKNEITNIM